MSSLRPHTHESHHRHRSRDRDNLQPHKHRHRSRSTSAVRRGSHSGGDKYRYTFAESPRRYVSNESRPRRPPPGPSVEDCGFGPDGVLMRGKPDQNPVLVEVSGDSSSETGSAFTPSGSSADGHDKRIRHPSKASAAADEQPVRQKPAQPQIASDRRGRPLGLTVDTDQARNSSGSSRPVNIERARSPYSYRPQKEEGQGQRRRSPDAADRANLRSRGAAPEAYHNSIHGHQQQFADRRASTMPITGGSSWRRRTSSLSESSSGDDDRPLSRPSHLASSTPKDYDDRNMTRFSDHSPPRSPMSPEHTRKTSLNRDSLLKGHGLQHLSSVLETHHSKARKASPRPSPAASPHESPPKTPPNEAAGRPARGLKVTPPLRNPSSSLSSRPSSPLADNTKQNKLAKERKASTWDSSARIQVDGPNDIKIDVRGPSPSAPQESQPPKLRPGASLDSSEAARTSRSHVLEPPVTVGRQRSSSSVEHSHRPVMSDRQVSSKKADLLSTSAAAAAGATLGAGLLDAQNHSRSRSTAPEPLQHRHRSRSRTVSDAKSVARSMSHAPAPLVPASDQNQPVLLPQCPRGQNSNAHNSWYSLDRYPSVVICSDCRRSVFGKGYERSFSQRSDARSRGAKPVCAMNDPWIRLACLIIFSKHRADTRLLGHLAEVSLDEPPCPQSKLADDRIWYHLRDSETGRGYGDFQVCSHCVCSLETIYPVLGDAFHRSRDLKPEPRVCNLRSDMHRLGKYLNFFGGMADDARAHGSNPATSDFIWEVKWMTVISPCKGDAVYYGEDMHTHPDVPGFTVCEECYFKTVRPLLKAPQPSRVAKGITPEPREIVGGVTCKLYSPRMRQIFQTACRDRDVEYLAKAVRKRNDLQLDLEQAKMILAKTPGDQQAKEDVAYLTDKWKKLSRRHD